VTDQVHETLIYKGERVAIREEPLGQYFDITGVEPPRDWISTACWRGYEGTWQVIDDRLYLTDINWVSDTAPSSLTSLFPGFEEAVFAHWFTGTIRISEPTHEFPSIDRILRIAPASRGVEAVDQPKPWKVALHVREGGVREEIDPPRYYGSFLRGLNHWREEFKPALADLTHRMTAEEIEVGAGVFDPLGYVPDRPFGHLNWTWEELKAGIGPKSEIWAFESTIDYHDHHGYALVEQGVVKHFMLTEVRETAGCPRRARFCAFDARVATRIHQTTIIGAATRDLPIWGLRNLRIARSAADLLAGLTEPVA